MNCNFITQILTEPDNVTHDLFKYIVLISLLVGLGLQIYVVVRGQAFDLMNFGAGVGALLTGAGVALNLKRDTQPSAGGAT